MTSSTKEASKETKSRPVVDLPSERRKLLGRILAEWGGSPEVAADWLDNVAMPQIVASVLGMRGFLGPRTPNSKHRAIEASVLKRGSSDPVNPEAVIDDTQVAMCRYAEHVIADLTQQQRALRIWRSDQGDVYGGWVEPTTSAEPAQAELASVGSTEA